jgi:hypothetical protein
MVYAKGNIDEIGEMMVRWVRRALSSRVPVISRENRFMAILAEEKSRPDEATAQPSADVGRAQANLRSLRAETTPLSVDDPA